MNLTAYGRKLKLSIFQRIPVLKRSCYFCRQHFENSHKHICNSCVESISKQSVFYHPVCLDDALPVYSLSFYRDVWKELVLQVKIAGNRQALAAIKELLDKYYLQDYEVVIPAASSAWSRIHGRYDLAWMMAKYLAKRNKAGFLESPWHLQWRWRKQVAKRKTYSPSKVYLPSLPNLQGKKVLLVDDVITTGATMKRLAACVKEGSRAGKADRRGVRCIGFTLCRAASL